MKNERGEASIIAIILIIIFIFFLSMVFTSDSGSSKKYDQKETLENAYNKSMNGQTLTKQEQRELDSYREWEKKTYGNNL